MQGAQPQAAGLESKDGTQDLLDEFYRAGLAGGFPAATVVGSGSDPSDFVRKLVDRLSQRLVLVGGRCRVAMSAMGIFHQPT